MSRFEASIDVNVPLRTVYNQWTQFEEFPLFMDGVKSVRQITDTKLHWVAEIAGRTEEWDAEIREQKPDTRISWRSISGAKNDGLVTFNYIDEHKTRVMLQIDYDPQGLIEFIGAALGIVQRRIAGDLKNFKGFIEDLGYETGAWRGQVSRFTGQTAPFGTRYNMNVVSNEAAQNGSPTPYVAQTALNSMPSHEAMTPRNGMPAVEIETTRNGGYVGAPSFTDPKETERGERNDVGENSFSSSESSHSSSGFPPLPKSENWSTSNTPPAAATTSPIDDIGNSDIAPGDEPAHGYGAVESEPQDEDWNEEDEVHSTPSFKR